jgi:hypothetical protein
MRSDTKRCDLPEDAETDGFGAVQFLKVRLVLRIQESVERSRGGRPFAVHLGLSWVRERWLDHGGNRSGEAVSRLEQDRSGAIGLGVRRRGTQSRRFMGITWGGRAAWRSFCYSMRGCVCCEVRRKDERDEISNGFVLVHVWPSPRRAWPWVINASSFSHWRDISTPPQITPLSLSL